MQVTTDKSLTKSLSLIKILLDRTFSFTHTQIIWLDNDEAYYYPNNQTIPVDFDYREETSIYNKSENKVRTSNRHPFKGLPSEIKSYTSLPLISSTKNISGLILLLDENERDLSTKEISILEDFARSIADAIEKQQENQRLQQVFTDFMHKSIHDLKNPLTSISLTSELLKRKADDPKMVLNFCEKLEKANQRLFSNLEKLKSAFPAEDNNFKLVINETNLNELLNDVKSTIRNINITTTNQIEKNIYADYNRLKEAIILLISKTHSSENTAITIKSFSKDKQAIIEISSSKEHDDHQSTALTISKTLIEMHGGRIETETDAFVIYLPSDNL
ncbi:GAF domain-containing sensor histidine kinase [Pedobacter xixiisoli]|uniref:histidine kinase n=1 Tax=Pedobacter xixiisoli TaxID=1476464 RepID=A0A285ZPS3_9SPHI|nr:GAF domain-containing sensor histidine kinase [Pedobacter xixiisoli]SOD11642.1 Signal transduction histidine kinase [Pedobacter xixiisoli]